MEQKRHHTSLCNKTVMSNQLLTSEQEHMESKSNANRKAKEKNKSQKSKSAHSENSVVAVTRSRSDQTVALPLAMLPIRCSSGVQYARAMFDTGSQRSFISHKTVEELNLEVIGRDCLAIKGFVGEINENTYDVIAIPVLSKFGLIMVEALSVPQVPSPITIPGISMHVQKLRKLKIALADPYINTDEIDIAILIGSDYYFSFVNGTKVAYDTFLLTSSLGHMIGGPIPSYNVKSKIQVCNINCSPQIEEMVTNLWNLESIGIMPETPKPDDINALQSFSNNISRIDNHYITKLPWKTFRPILPTNYGLALGRLKSTIKQLEKLGEVGAYEKVIQEQLQSGFIERVEYPNKKSDNIIHYIPHLPVWKKDSSTTPLRIVYDCSAGNPSLNDCLCSGPSLNNDMVKILLRFRTDKFACVADISKAYLKIGLHDSDRDATRFLWISDPNNIDSEILIYRFKVILFGATCSQFLLNATINHHLKQYNENSISNYILRNIYVDNLQATANAEHELLRFYTQSKTIFEEANLFLCEWATNSALLSKTIIENRDGTKNTAKPVKILGMLWDTESDLLYYPQRDIISTNSVTKRSILSQTAQIFDPLGFITPVTVSARIFLQKLWSLKMDWDIPLSEEIISEWDTIKKQCLEVRETALLPRCVGFKGKVDVHVFCDASKYAYGAVAYLCSKEGNQFLMAKTRVAPLKALTIPRLELTAALIGARLVSFICDAYEKEFEILQTDVWSDSKVALCWIKSQKQLDPYVSNRVHEIKNLLPSASWNYVPTKQNPADLVTKGITAKQFHESIIWKTGPNWLANKEDWPSFDMAVVMDVFLPVGEEIKEIVSQSKMQPIIDLSRFNNLKKLFRVTLLVFKFISQCRSNILCIQTIDDAEKYWVSIVQGEVYENAYNSLNKKETHKHTIVKQLQLFLDGSIIRCRGRIDHSTLPWETKNPILLPSKHHFTNLVILNSHAKHHHMGVSFVVNDLRQRWWIPQIRQRVKSTIRPCVTCKRYQGSSFQTPITPPLPSHRLEEAPPFTITGIDYSGYLNVRYGNQVVKAYIALFTCAVTRAIHLELVQDNTCESFMLALRRFIGRRSCPAFIFSDNSTTFRSASDVVARMYQNDVQHYLKNQRCEWRFIPPRAPWFGGIWERLIGLTKSCLKKVLGKALVSFIEIQTVIIEIEATLNDRPLTVVGSDLSDGAALTPSYLLYGHHITSLPAANVDPDLTYNEKELLTARQKKLEGIRTKFWSRFRSEYLLSLRERKLPSDNNIPLAPEVGEIVLINDDSKRHFWKLGKVLKLNKGIDGHIRSVILKTENGDICRPVSRLYPLEIRSREINDLDNLDSKQNSKCTIQRKAAIEARKRIASQL